MEDQLDEDESMYTITCVGPLSVKVADQFVKEQYEIMNEKRILERHQIMAKQLTVTYRNSSEIQLFYNVYLAHRNSMAKKDNFSGDHILSVEMNQPKMDLTHSSNRDGDNDNLPTGTKPTLILSKKKSEKWSENDIRDIQEKIVDLIDVEKNSFAAICHNKEKKACTLCHHMNEKYQKNAESMPKLNKYLNGKQFGEPPLHGCETDHLLIHYHYSVVRDRLVEFDNISRARKKLILMMDLEHLDIPSTFYETMKELRYHAENCKNDTCMKHKWDQKKIIEVVEVGKDDELDESDSSVAEGTPYEAPFIYRAQ